MAAVFEVKEETPATKEHTCESGVKFPDLSSWFRTTEEALPWHCSLSASLLVLQKMSE
jgi:hypothetical protein